MFNFPGAISKKTFHYLDNHLANFLADTYLINVGVNDPLIVNIHSNITQLS